MWIFSRVLVIAGLLLSVGLARAIEQPGPSAALLANPTYSGGIGRLYTCVRNFYVATTGNDGNNGSQASPWLTIQNADSAARQPGDCVNVAAGTYTWAAGFAPTHNGNSASPTGYVTYRCQTLNACLVVYNGVLSGHVWAFTNPYWIIDGFDVDGGEAATYGGLANVCFDSSIPDTITPGHHIWILNNKIHGCNLAGVGFQDSEYFFIIHNEVHRNAWTSGFQGSGIGLVSLKALGDNLNPYPPYTPTIYDRAFAPFHNIVSWNLVHENGCTVCLGVSSTFSTTGNVHSNTTLDGIASTGTSATFTASITGTTLTVSAAGTGTVAIGQVVTATTGIDVAQGTVITGGADPTWTVNLPQTVTGQSMRSDTVAQLQLVTSTTAGCILPFTYLATNPSSAAATLTRPTTCTQSAIQLTFQTLNGGHTDGNGIIMDTFCGVSCGGTGTQDYNYTDKQTLVSLNDCQFNGGRGVHLFAVFNVTAANNSCYHNGIDVTLQGLIGDLSQAGGVNNNWYNNIAYTVDSGNPFCPSFLNGHCNNTLVAGDARGIVDTNITYFNNVLFGGGGTALFNNDSSVPYFVPVNNKPAVDPLYVNESSQVIGNLQLQAASPAIEYAFPHSFAFIPKGTTDAGAWQTGGIRTANFIGGFPDFTGGIGFQTLAPIAPPLSCAQATTWLNFIVTIQAYDRVHNDAYSNLICGMVNDGIWCGSLFDIFYVFATYNQSISEINLCAANYASPTFTAVPHGGPTWTIDKGFAGVDASSSVYIDTTFDPFSAVSPKYTANAAHLSAWINNNVQSSDSGGVIGGAIFGVHNTPGGGTTSFFPRQFAGFGTVSNFFANINNDNFSFTGFFDQTSSLGHFLVQRTSATAVAAYWNSSLRFSYTTAELNTSGNIFILAENNNGSPMFGASQQVGAVTIGTSLTTGQIASLCHRLNIFMTAIGNGQSGTC